MTTFKVGDRVRRTESTWRLAAGGEYSVTECDADVYDIRLEGEGASWFNAAHFELVEPAPSERLTEIYADGGPVLPVGVERSAHGVGNARGELSRQLNEKQSELDAFKAKVVEELSVLYMITDLDQRAIEIAQQRLGLTPEPSRYRVTFEVEAENEEAALAVVCRDASGTYVSNGATVEKIVEE